MISKLHMRAITETIASFLKPYSSALAAMIVLILLSGCTTNHHSLSSFVNSSEERFIDAKTFIRKTPTYRYRIQPGDTLRIDFVGELAGNRDITVQPDGWLAIPYIDSIKASGLTMPELEEKLENKYTEILRFNDIQLDIIESQPLFVYVGGEVIAGGKQQFRERTTVQQAILAAGGTSNGAAVSKVFVVRDIGSSKPAYIAFDFKNERSEIEDNENPTARPRRANRTERVLYLHPNDIVIVPRTNISKLSHFINSYINEILPFSRSVNVFYDYQEGLNNG